jgi:hypothetical protein
MAWIVWHFRFFSGKMLGHAWKMLALFFCQHFLHTMNILNNLDLAADDLPPQFPDTPWAQRLMPLKGPPPVPKKRSAMSAESPKIRKLHLDVESLVVEAQTIEAKEE